MKQSLQSNNVTNQPTETLAGIINIEFANRDLYQFKEGRGRRSIRPFIHLRVPAVNIVYKCTASITTLLIQRMEIKGTLNDFKKGSYQFGAYCVPAASVFIHIGLQLRRDWTTNIQTCKHLLHTFDLYRNCVINKKSFCNMFRVVFVQKIVKKESR